MRHMALCPASSGGVRAPRRARRHQAFDEGSRRAGPHGTARRALSHAVDAHAEAAAKAVRNYGGSGYAASVGTPPWHEHFGLVIVSCERADVRPLPNGVLVYGDDVKRMDALNPPAVPRRPAFVDINSTLHIFLFEVTLRQGSSCSVWR